METQEKQHWRLVDHKVQFREMRLNRGCSSFSEHSYRHKNTECSDLLSLHETLFLLSSGLCPSDLFVLRSYKIENQCRSKGHIFLRVTGASFSISQARRQVKPRRSLCRHRRDYENFRKCSARESPVHVRQVVSIPRCRQKHVSVGQT